MVFLTSALCSKDDNINDVKSLTCDNLINDPIDGNDSFYIFIPNAFTPNKDGVDDRLYLFLKNIATLKMTIFDENSNIVFQAENLNQQWDPNSSSVTEQTYYYRIEATSTTGKRIGMCGEVYPLSCVPKNSSDKYFFQNQFNGYFFDPSLSSGEDNICP